MVELTTRDAGGTTRRVRISMAGLDLTDAERRLLRNARFPDFLRRLLSAGSVLLVVAFLAAIASTSTNIEWFLGAAGAAFALGMTALVAGGVWIVCRWIDFNEARVLADGWLRVGRCAACGFPLAPAPADAAGVRTCPECGATWRLAR